MNPLFNAMGGGQNPMVQMLQQLRANPVQVLMQRKMNIPSNIAGDPNAILQHLVSTGQITQEQVNAAYQQAGRLRQQ